MLKHVAVIALALVSACSSKNTAEEPTSPPRAPAPIAFPGTGAQVMTPENLPAAPNRPPIAFVKEASLPTATPPRTTPVPTETPPAAGSDYSLSSTELVKLEGSQWVPATQVNVVSTRDLALRLQWTGTPGTYHCRVQFVYLGNGQPAYYKDGTESVVIDSSGQAASEIRMEVSGSQISNYNLLGAWEARVTSGSTVLATVPFTAVR